jgi:hypothetical protein
MSDDSVIYYWKMIVQKLENAFFKSKNVDMIDRFALIWLLCRNEVNIEIDFFFFENFPNKKYNVRNEFGNNLKDWGRGIQKTAGSSQ